MPSKGKKSSRPSPRTAASLDRSPSPLSLSTPYRPPRNENNGDDDDDDDELRLRRLISEASAKFPALISDSAFYGQISGPVSSSPSEGNQAKVFLSESAMVSFSLVPGSLVSVSLAAPRKETSDNSPVDTLGREYIRRFDMNDDDRLFNEAGSFFAIAIVEPDHKVLKDRVRLSWTLARTMGSPAMGTTVFVCAISSHSTSHHLNTTGNVSCVHILKCEDLYLNMVPQKSGLISSGINLSASDASINTTDIHIGNEKIASPKTPACHSMLSSPGVTPPSSRKLHDFSPSVEFSLCWDSSAARLALEDEGYADLLQTFAVRWLNGRYLINGNFVTVPTCGHLCDFRVESADKHPADCSSQDFNNEGICKIDVALLVGTETKALLSGSIPSVKENQTKVDQPKDVIPRLGGLSKEFTALKEIIQFSLANTNGFPRYKGVLLHGPPGTGKTSLASYCARDAGARLFPINGPEIVSPYYGETEQALREVFDLAKKEARAVVFIDELDAIAPVRKDGSDELSLRMVATLQNLMDEINRTDGVLVIAATNRPDSIDPSLRRPGRLDKEIEIGVPSPDQRLDILQALLSEIDHSLSDIEIRSLASATHGFVGADLAALCNEAAMAALHRHIKLKSSGTNFREPYPVVDMVLDMPSGKHVDLLSSMISELTVSSSRVSPANIQGRLEGNGFSQCDSYPFPREEKEMLLKVMVGDFDKAKKKVRPSGMREIMLELPEIHWEDVGGQNTVKSQLIEAVQWPQICPDAFERIGIRPPRGLLMIGPPGCSKTLMARAVASEAKLNFFAVKGPELFSKWVGESEKAVRSLFAKARANSPAIIFFDEIDGLATTRGHENDGNSVGDRVLTQLLVEMDGLDQRVGVTVIAATNRPDKIDPALLRPGRFDRLLDVQPPDEKDRGDIFRIHTRSIPCGSDISTQELARLTEGYTGADIKLVCREASIAALEERLDITEVSMAHFRLGIERVQPSDVQFFRELASRFRRTVDPGSVPDE